MDYWKVCISEAFEDAGITATDEQISTVASWVEGAHDNYGMARGYNNISDPRDSENERLKRELEKERDKITCPDCNGSGRIVTHGPVHSSNMHCSKCNGEGRIHQ